MVSCHNKRESSPV